MQRGQPNAFEGLDMSGWLSANTPPGFSPVNGLDIDFDAWESAQRSAAKADFSSLAMPAPFTPQQPQQPQQSQQAPPKQPPQLQPQMQQQMSAAPLITLPQQSSAQGSRAKRTGSTRTAKASETASTKRSKRATQSQKQQKQQKQGQQDQEPQQQDKRYLNKLAADKYRRKKRQQFEELTAKSQSLEQENHRLKTQCSTLENQVDFLKQALLSAVQNTAKQAPQPSAEHASPSSSFDMEEFAKAYMKKHAQESTARIQQLEQKVAALSTQLQTQP